MKVKLGLLGENISYTLSPKVHAVIFDYLGIDGSFTVFDTGSGEMGGTYRRMCDTLNGFNVTKPYKTEVAARVDKDFSQVGAVNTVKCGSTTIGYNTDGFGFMRSFEENKPLCIGEHVLVLGAGGAARVVAYMLKEAGYKVSIHNRTKEKAERLAGEMQVKVFGGEAVSAVVNCTSCGYHNDDPTDGMNLNGVKYAYDLIYNPERTPMLKKFESMGVTVVNGLDMLIYQAIRADELIIDGITLEKSDYEKITEKVRKEIKR